MTRSLLVSIALAMTVVIAGCGSAAEESSTADVADTAAGDTDVAESDGDPTAASGGTSVLMMGRSVMAGWFEHWGWNWDGPVEWNGFTLTYGELDSPPTIASSACEYIRTVPEGSVVFFKFCFVDFYGADGQEGEAQLDELEGWVEEVVSCAEQQGVALILGNALPQVEGDTDAALVAQHRAYNAWLEEYAAERGDSVRVLDLYGTLSTSGGWLRSESALGSHDSHLDDSAYGQLDPMLFDLLAEMSQ